MSTRTFMICTKRARYFVPANSRSEAMLTLFKTSDAKSARQQYGFTSIMEVKP